MHSLDGTEEMSTFAAVELFRILVWFARSSCDLLNIFNFSKLDMELDSFLISLFWKTSRGKFHVGAEKLFKKDLQQFLEAFMNVKIKTLDGGKNVGLQIFCKSFSA